MLKLCKLSNPGESQLKNVLIFVLLLACSTLFKRFWTSISVLNLNLPLPWVIVMISYPTNLPGPVWNTIGCYIANVSLLPAKMEAGSQTHFLKNEN